MKLTFIGAGGLAHNLAPALGQRHTILQVLSQQLASAEQLAFLIASASAGDMSSEVDAQAEVIILAVPDSQIAEVAETMAPRLTENQILVHCAGSVPLSVLDCHKGPIGVLYPLQTFSKERRVEWTDVPLFLEGASGGLEKLQELVIGLTNTTPRVMTSEARKVVHLGAVLAANFVNALIAQSGRIVADLELDHKVYLPLAKEVVAKLEYLNPIQAQTGPAMRGDKETITEQKALLRETAAELIPLYELLTQVINRMRETSLSQ